MSYTNQQPYGTQSMSVNGGNRNAKNLPFNADGEREWSTGIFDCVEDPLTFVTGWFLPCLVYGKNKTRLEALQAGAPHPTGGEILGNDTIIYGALHCCALGWVFGMANRAATREHYKIEGNAVNDCLLSAFCAPCALTQQSREIELEEQSLGHAGGGMAQFIANPPKKI